MQQFLDALASLKLKLKLQNLGHMGPRLAAPWTSTSSTLDLDSRRHGTLTQIYGAANNYERTMPQTIVSTQSSLQGAWEVTLAHL